jgi:hypothetical protein
MTEITSTGAAPAAEGPGRGLHHPVFAVAERLAPEPKTREEATPELWVRHYAAAALAAYVAFYAEVSGVLGLDPASEPPASQPNRDIGPLITISIAYTSAAAALHTSRSEVGGILYDLTPELGCLNGENVDWLASTLDELGINPADLFPAYNAADFNSTPVGSAPEEA